VLGKLPDTSAESINKALKVYEELRMEETQDRRLITISIKLKLLM